MIALRAIWGSGPAVCTSHQPPTQASAAPVTSAGSVSSTALTPMLADPMPCADRTVNSRRRRSTQKTAAAPTTTRPTSTPAAVIGNTVGLIPERASCERVANAVSCDVDDWQPWQGPISVGNVRLTVLIVAMTRLVCSAGILASARAKLIVALPW